MFKKFVLVITLLIFMMTSTVGSLPIYAQAAWSIDEALRLPEPGAMVHLSPQYNAPILKGIKVHLNNPFRFDFILDQGDSLPLVGRAREGDLKQESTRLIKYFLASLTVPEKDLWVNLSPYEKNRIIPPSFGLTEMGRDLLAEDYMLKQITASLIYPEDVIGKKFWARIYEKSAKQYGTTNVAVNTFNKVWIVPEKAVVYENAKAQTAYVVEARLKVMLEEDYLALEKNRSRPGDMFKQEQQRTCPQAGCQANQGLNTKAPQGNHLTPSIGSQVLRAIVIPELTQEVNEGKNFAQLRQVYNSLILATWYKKKIKDSILAQVYADKNKIKGLLSTNQNNMSSPNVFIGDPQHIYQQYLKAFKKGVFNYIKEEVSPPLDGEGKGGVLLPRKYFSGGILFDAAQTTSITNDERVIAQGEYGKQYFKVIVDINQAMLAGQQTPMPPNPSTNLKEGASSGEELIGITAEMRDLAKKAEKVRQGHLLVPEQQDGIKDLLRIERLRIILLERLGIINQSTQVLSFLNGADPLIFEKVQGMGLDSRDMGKAYGAAREKIRGYDIGFDDGLRKEGDPLRRSLRNYLGFIKSGFEDPGEIKKQIDRHNLLVEQHWLSEPLFKPNIFYLKRTEQWFIGYLRHSLEKGDSTDEDQGDTRYLRYSLARGNMSYGEADKVAKARYERALRVIVQSEIVPKDGGIFIVISNSLQDSITGETLESLGYRNILPTLLPAGAIQNLKEASALGTDIRVAKDVVVSLGGAMSVYVKSNRQDQAMAADHGLKSGSVLAMSTDSLNKEIQAWIDGGQDEIAITANDGAIFKFEHQQENQSRYHRIDVFLNGHKIGYIHFEIIKNPTDMAWMQVGFSGYNGTERHYFSHAAIFVDPEVSSGYKGIGRSLLGLAERLAYLRGARQFYAADVNQSNFENFYKRLGYYVAKTPLFDDPQTIVKYLDESPFSTIAIERKSIPVKTPAGIGRDRDAAMTASQDWDNLRVNLEKAKAIFSGVSVRTYLDALIDNVMSIGAANGIYLERGRLQALETNGDFKDGFVDESGRLIRNNGPTIKAMRAQNKQALQVQGKQYEAALVAKLDEEYTEAWEDGAKAENLAELKRHLVNLLETAMTIKNMIDKTMEDRGEAEGDRAMIGRAAVMQVAAPIELPSLSISRNILSLKDTPLRTLLRHLATEVKAIKPELYELTMDEYQKALGRLGTAAGVEGATALYPFGGFDILKPLRTIHGVTDVISVGLDSFGSPGDLQKILSLLPKDLLEVIGIHGFDVPGSLYKRLQDEYNVKGLGALAIIRIIAQLKGQVIGVSYFQLGKDGRPLFDIDEKRIPEERRCANAVVEFLDQDGRLKRFWYLKQNIASLPSEFRAFLRGIDFQTLFLVGTVYTMEDAFIGSPLVEYFFHSARRNGARVITDQRLSHSDQQDEPQPLPIWRPGATSYQSIRLRAFASDGFWFGFGYSTGDEGLVYSGSADDLIDEWAPDRAMNAGEYDLWSRSDVKSLESDLRVYGLKSKKFKKLSEAEIKKLYPQFFTWDFPDGMDVYRHKETNLEIVKKGTASPFQTKNIGIFIKERRRSAVPTFLDYLQGGSIGWADVYELNLVPFGYISLGSYFNKYFNRSEKRIFLQVREAINDALRFGSNYWFLHGHLHEENILVKVGKSGNILDVKILDWNHLHKVNISQLIVTGMTRKELAQKVNDKFFSNGAHHIPGGLVWTEGRNYEIEMANMETDEPVILSKATFLKKRPRRDMAMAVNGGIDLTPAHMNVQTKMPANLSDWRGLASFAGGDSRLRGNDIGRGEDDTGIKFHLDPAQLAELQNAPGFEPVIISVQPLKNLREFLGIG